MQKILAKNYTMVNCIEGGTTLLFSTFDKNQLLWRYRTFKLGFHGIKLLILGNVPTKSPFSQKLRKFWPKNMSFFKS